MRANISRCLALGSLINNRNVFVYKILHASNIVYAIRLNSLLQIYEFFLFKLFLVYFAKILLLVLIFSNIIRVRLRMCVALYSDKYYNSCLSRCLLLLLTTYFLQ